MGDKFWRIFEDDKLYSKDFTFSHISKIATCSWANKSLVKTKRNKDYKTNDSEHKILKRINTALDHLLDYL